MGIIIALILGGFVGWLASLVVGKDAQIGLLGNIIVGILGSMLGNFISYMLTGAGRSALVFDLSSLVWAFLGSVTLLVVFNLITGRGVRG